MIHLSLGLTNPFKSTIFDAKHKPILYKNGDILSKNWELEVDQSNCVIWFEFSIFAFNREYSHTNLGIAIGLLGYEIRFSIYTIANP